ncbi:hypothetical protein [Borrelia sp. RT5S]|uniref:hypothetical protein n=1 Tax=Borrelia sp. RT5S TaxID=2898581 RepID=UPI001E4D163D|nr:hypothetical protein [Borrelia sp. RT5S]UGQ16778.1 hypothetical protein LSO06_05505 [Borrelia sp. RT5S]
MKRLGVLLFALLSVLMGCGQEGSGLLRLSKFYNPEEKVGKTDTEEKEAGEIDTNKANVVNAYLLLGSKPADGGEGSEQGLTEVEEDAGSGASEGADVQDAGTTGTEENEAGAKDASVDTTDVVEADSLGSEPADEGESNGQGLTEVKENAESETNDDTNTVDEGTKDASEEDADVRGTVTSDVPVTNEAPTTTSSVPVTIDVPVVDNTNETDTTKTNSLEVDQVDAEEKQRQEAAKQRQDAYLELEQKLKKYKAKLESARGTFEAGRHSFTALLDKLGKMGGVFMDFGHYNTSERRNYIYSSFNYDANEIKQFEEIFVKLPINRLDLGKIDDQFVAKKLIELLNLIGTATHTVLNESFSDANLLRLKDNQDTTVVPTASSHLDDFISEREALIDRIKRHLSLAGNKKHDEALMREELMKMTGSKTEIQQAKTNFFKLRRQIERLLK